MNDEFLTYIKSHPYWPIFKQQLINLRPSIPSHDPDSDNTEQWKSFSAQQRGFDLCLSFFQLDKE